MREYDPNMRRAVFGMMIERNPNFYYPTYTPDNIVAQLNARDQNGREVYIKLWHDDLTFWSIDAKVFGRFTLSHPDAIERICDHVDQAGFLPIPDGIS